MHIPASCLEAIIELSSRLDWLERQPGRDVADEYQAVVARLKRLLAMGLPAYAIDPVLDAHASTAELYENLQYARGGLSRAPLQMAVGSAIVAIELLEAVRTLPRQSTPRVRG